MPISTTVPAGWRRRKSAAQASNWSVRWVAPIRLFAPSKREKS
ncbi:hypothetical protein [Streptomyces sp. AS02]|nr:hypothetical protein [Streptomyces sp. AS02]